MTADCTVPSHLNQQQVTYFVEWKNSKFSMEFKYLKGIPMTIGHSLAGTCHSGCNPPRLPCILPRNADLITSIIPKLSPYWKLLDTCRAELLQYQQSLILFGIYWQNIDSFWAKIIHLSPSRFKMSLLVCVTPGDLGLTKQCGSCSEQNGSIEGR